MMQNTQAEQTTNMFMYHEFVSNGNTSIYNSIVTGQDHHAKKLMKLSWEYAATLNNVDITPDTIKDLDKLDADMLFAKMVKEQDKAGLSPRQLNYSGSFYHQVIAAKKKKG